MAGEWERVSIAELCDAGVAQVQTGPFGSQLHAYDYVEQGVPVVPTEAISNRRIDHSVLPKISPDKAGELARHLLRPGDILFARRGVQATGQVGYITEKEAGFLCGTGAIRLRVCKTGKVDASFLSHVLANPASTAWFKYHAIGATMPNLNEGIIRNFSFKLPPLSEQLAIAGLLSALDDKIELNRRMAETLEATIQALFKSWFVDFEPVQAKAESRAVSLPVEVASLFPRALNEEGIPEGWARQPLSKIVAQRRETIDPALLGEILVEHYSLPAFDAGGRPAVETATAIKSLKLSLSPPVILFSKLNPDTPRIWPILTQTTRPMLASTEFLALLPSSADVPLSFVKSLLASPPFRDRAASMVTGTSKSHQRVQPQALLATKWVIAPTPVLAAFDAIAGTFLERGASLLKEITALAKLRDTLLPRLMSGELRVRDADKVAAA